MRSASSCPLITIIHSPREYEYVNNRLRTSHFLLSTPYYFVIFHVAKIGLINRNNLWFFLLETTSFCFYALISFLI